MSYLALCFDIFLINKLPMQKRHSYLIFCVQRKNMSSYWISQRPMCGTWRKQPIMVGRQWEEMGQTRQRYDTFVNEAKNQGWGKCSYLLRASMDTQNVFLSYNAKCSEREGRSGHIRFDAFFLSSYLGHPYTNFQKLVTQTKRAAYCLQVCTL